MDHLQAIIFQTENRQCSGQESLQKHPWILSFCNILDKNNTVLTGPTLGSVLTVFILG